MSEPTDMREVRLMTSQNQIVAVVRIPFFTTAPEAISWGSRCFFHMTADEYVEGFLYVVPQTSTHK